MFDAAKPGLKTTEFYLVLGFLVTIVLSGFRVAPACSGDACQTLVVFALDHDLLKWAAATVIGYATSRGLAKNGSRPVQIVSAPKDRADASPDPAPAA